MFRLAEHALFRIPERIHTPAIALWDRSAIPVSRDPLQSMFRLTEHALPCFPKRIHAALDRSAIPVSRDPL